MSKHTPEPWISGGTPGGVWVDVYLAVGGPVPQPPEGEQIGDFTALADAARAVACVNACAGINPEAVPLMLELIRRLRFRFADSRFSDVVAPQELTNYPEDETTTWMTELDAALAKATEVQP